MLKFTDTKIVFQEIPDQITLAINISGCPCACEGCHSSYLAEDVGEDLSVEALGELLKRNDSISCLSFMGGDREPSHISRLAAAVRDLAPGIMVAWYSGRDQLSQEVDLQNFDFVKIGSYQSDRGALDSPSTNQRLYRVDRATQQLIDITYKMQR